MAVQIAYLGNLRLLDVSSSPSLGTPIGEPEERNLALNPGLPSEIGMLTHLKILKLQHSGFSGTLPTEIGELTHLERLWARGSMTGLEPVTTRFSGTLPTEIGKLRQLIDFSLSDNRLSGSIPCQIGAMHMLTRWEVQENSLSGTMPDAFTALPHLELWDTYGNYMVGDLPPSIENVSATLNYLYIQSEHTDALRNFRCRDRIPGIGSLINVNVNVNGGENFEEQGIQIPSNQPGNKYNWYIQVAEYFNYKYMSMCVDPYDSQTAFEALSGDV